MRYFAVRIHAGAFIMAYKVNRRAQQLPNMVHFLRKFEPQNKKARRDDFLSGLSRDSIFYMLKNTQWPGFAVYIHKCLQPITVGAAPS
jgi:hypothetical protein